MKLIYSKNELRIFELKVCHSCGNGLIYTRYPDKPHKNKGYVICECGHRQSVYDPFLTKKVFGFNENS